MTGTAAQIVLVRHGETEWSRSGRHTGRTDLPLTSNGRAEADRVATRLRGREFSLVLCSPLRRARETLARVGVGGPVEIDDDLREWDYGEYEGRTTEEIRRQVPGWTVWTHPVVGGESAGEVGQRADAVLARAVAAGGDVALFGHGHALRVLAARWLGLPPEAGRLLALGTATLSTLGLERDTQVLLHWNERT